MPVQALQATLVEPFKVEIRQVTLPDPAPNQILLAAEATAISAGTELAVYTGTHQWLKDPSMPDWKFPFRPGYSAAGRVVAVGKDFPGGFQPGERVSYPGNHATHELLTVGHERCRVWRMPENLPFEKAAVACVARYGMGAAIRAGLTLGRSAAVLGLGDIGPLASMPVMEGKAVLFKKFAGIDVFDIEVNENDPDKLVEIIAALEPTFGGINLEDIKAPDCFVVERKLQARMKIPVFHDDQHGTAIISAAALLNALELQEKKIEDVKDIKIENNKKIIITDNNIYETKSIIITWKSIIFELIMSLEIRICVLDI